VRGAQIQMPDYVIERDIPIPPAKYGKEKSPGHGLRVYPFPDMQSGDSFKVSRPHDVPHLSLLLYRLASAAQQYAYRREEPQPHFVCRTLPDEDCVRVWRDR
jgi:hypothetical protein